MYSMGNFAKEAFIITLAAVASACSSVSTGEEDSVGQVQAAAAGEPAVDFDGPDFIRVPAGRFHRSCIHEVPNRAKIENTPDGFEISLDGKSSGTISKCPHPHKLSVGQPPAINGWIEGSERVAPTNGWGFNWYNKLVGKFPVPDNPSSNGALVYFFNYLKPSDHSAIIQPVLQWGSNGFYPGGNFWQVAPWYVGGSDVFYGVRMTVSPGDTIIGTMRTLSGCNTNGTNCSWEINADPPGLGSTSILLSINKSFRLAGQAALEAYLVTSCNHYPSTGWIMFYDTFAYQPGPGVTNLNEMALSGAWTTFVDPGLSPACGYQVTNFTRGSTLEF